MLECIICKVSLKGWDDTKDTWNNGERIIICKKPECNKEYTRLKRKEFQNKHNAKTTT